MNEGDIALLALVIGVPWFIGHLFGEAWGWLTLIVICALLVALWRLTVWLVDCVLPRQSR